MLVEDLECKFKDRESKIGSRKSLVEHVTCKENKPLD